MDLKLSNICLGVFCLKSVPLKTMVVLYNILVNGASLLAKLMSLFSPKLKLFFDGRSQTFSILAKKIKFTDRVIWFHCASLGEFEQGRPVIEKAKQLFPKHKIVVSFFSPSGYEIRKNYELADAVVYLPIDTPQNAAEFIRLIHPELAIFVKYEFWPNLLNQLNQKKIPTILISGIFRKNQVFFKFYGAWMRNKLKTFSHFFVQDNNSKKLLNAIGFDNVTLSGDTRFDRVVEILNLNYTLDFLADFKNNQYTLVAGSTWPDDDQLLVNYINNHASSEEKFIIAPHNINPIAIKKLQKNLQVKSVLFSNYNNQELKTARVFIVDTIGILTKVYRYADVAYVGGGFNKGIHNILEPTTFGIPIVIGPKYQKFKEAVDLIHLKSCTVVENKKEFSATLQAMYNANNRKEMGQKSIKYIQSNTGATDLIIRYMNHLIKN